MTQSCKTCAYLKVPLNMKGRRIVRLSYVYGCAAPYPKEPVASDSVSLHNSWKRIFHEPWLSRYMEGKDGTTCPVWRPLPKPEKTS